MQYKGAFQPINTSFPFVVSHISPQNHSSLDLQSLGKDERLRELIKDESIKRLWRQCGVVDFRQLHNESELIGLLKLYPTKRNNQHSSNNKKY